MSGVERKALHALLIGIDHYLPPEPGHRGPSYRSLGGCVHDVERMEDFLRQRLEIPASNLRTLTAPDPPRPTASSLPTYENMVTAFEWLIETAQPGSQALVHFSGHGGRAPTHFAELKQDDPWDEALVPTNISRASARYLRDVELAYLLSRLAEKGVFATVVLDCCHAGGALRDELPSRVPNPQARYNRISDWQRPGRSMVAPEAELSRRWRLLSGRRGRLGSDRDRPSRRWLPGLDRLVLLAACAPHEKAFEYRVSPERQGGALTHWLLDTLERKGTDLTYRQLHEHIRAQIRARIEAQTPQIQGDLDRFLLQGRGRDGARPAITVLAVEIDRLLLNTGEAQGVRTGDRFTIFAGEGSGSDAGERCLAEVEVCESGGAESWARYLEPLEHEAPEPGCRALPRKQGSFEPRQTVRLPTGETAAACHSLAALAHALRLQGKDLLEVVAPGETAKWTVIINPQGNFEILDSKKQPVPNLVPTVPAAQRGAGRSIADRLIHIARFFDLLALSNSSLHAPTIRAQLSLLPAGYDAEQAEKPRHEPETLIEPSTEVKIGDWLYLNLANLSRQPLFFAVLNLRPRWGIRQIFPSGGDWLVIESGQEEDLFLQASLPGELQTATDRLKVFATLDAVRFDWLEMPDLDGRQIIGSTPEQPRNRSPDIGSLGALRSAVADREWATTVVGVRIRR